MPEPEPPAEEIQAADKSLVDIVDNAEERDSAKSPAKSSDSHEEDMELQEEAE